jgi:hypothetical protein
MKRPTKHEQRCDSCGHRLGLSLTKSDVVEIKTAINSGVTMASLARKFDVTIQAIWRIKKGKVWKNVDPQVNPVSTTVC